MNSKKPAIVLIGIFILLFFFFIAGCGKKNLAPVLTLKTSADSTAILFSDTLRIEGTATDDEGLHEFSVQIIGTTADTVFLQSPYVHNLKAYNFSYKFKFASAGNFTVNAVAIDHEQEIAITTRPIIVL